MHTLTRLFMAALFSLTATTGLTLATAPAAALADRDDARGNPQSCINPAGHVRGWCKHHNNNCNGGYWSLGRWIPIPCTNNTCRRHGDDDEQGDERGERGDRYNGYNNNGCNGYGYNGQYNGPNNNGGYYGQQQGNAEISGIVTAVSGSRITILQGFSAVNIDASQAYRNGEAYNVGLGSTITAYGYYTGNNQFVAYRIS